jgi:hypothetical protein
MGGCEAAEKKLNAHLYYLWRENPKLIKAN